MSLKSILILSFGFAVIMLIGAALLAFISNDTATHGQGPLNPRDADSVRQVAKGARDALVPVIVGLGVLVTALGLALKKAWAINPTEAAE